MPHKEETFKGCCTIAVNRPSDPSLQVQLRGDLYALMWLSGFKYVRLQVNTDSISLVPSRRKSKAQKSFKLQDETHGFYVEVRDDQALSLFGAEPFSAMAVDVQVSEVENRIRIKRPNLVQLRRARKEFADKKGTAE